MRLGSVEDESRSRANTRHFATVQANDKDQRLATRGLSMQPDSIASPLHRLVLRLLKRPRRSVALLTPL